MEVIKNKLILGLAIILSSCSGRMSNNQVWLDKFEKDEVKNFIEKTSKNASYVSSKEISSVSYKVNFVPVDLEAIKRLDYKIESKDSLKNYFNEFRKTYHDVYFFNFFIRNKTGDDCLKDLSSEMQ